jgi:hypothetical protein
MGRITVTSTEAGVVAHVAKMQDFDIPCDERITCDGVENVKRVGIAGATGDLAPCGCVTLVQRNGRFGALEDGPAGYGEGNRAVWEEMGGDQNEELGGEIEELRHLAQPEDNLNIKRWIEMKSINTFILYPDACRLGC